MGLEQSRIILLQIISVDSRWGGTGDIDGAMRFRNRFGKAEGAWKNTNPTKKTFRGRAGYLDFHDYS